MAERAVVTWGRIAGITPLVVGAALLAPAAGRDATPDVATIVRQWTDANRADFKAALEYNFSETIRNDDGVKTYDVTMLFGTPYKRLVRVDGKPLSAEDQRKETEKFERERASRAAESPDDRAHRIADFESDRERAHRVIEEMPRAFQYALVQKRSAGARTVYVLRATPRPGYDPPDAESQVLTGMRGEFWIDTATSQLVRGVARVLRPVSIEGFLARVEPGTEFEVTQQPVGPGIWLPTHFTIRSRSAIVFLFHHHTDEERTYFNYRRTSGA
jgi:hypothetical protein